MNDIAQKKDYILLHNITRSDLSIFIVSLFLLFLLVVICKIYILLLIYDTIYIKCFTYMYFTY